MHLERLMIDGVRNLAQQRVELRPGPSLFFGDNGSGKTSVLEAVHLIGTGRSFRTHTARPLIMHGSDCCFVQARIVKSKQQHSAGIRRHRSGESELRLDGEEATSLAALAELLPLVLLDTDGLELVTGAPEQRRRYLDGALFHVEQPFLEVWRRFQRVLRQRNAGLRRGMLAEDGVWLEELARAGEALTQSRARMAATLETLFLELVAGLSGELGDVSLAFRQGWDQKQSLLAALQGSIESDQGQGFTRVGPHRADLKVLWGGRSAADVMSRGQTKLTVAALRLAQGRLIEQRLGFPPVYLVDDMAAELDRGHARRVCGVLAASGGQVLMTAVDRNDIESIWPGNELSLFHVEQGSVLAAG